MTFLVFSVLPAPDSPVHKIDWSSRSTKEIERKKMKKKWLNMGNNILIFLKRNVQIVNGLKPKMADKVCCLFVSFLLYFLLFFFVVSFVLFV